MFTYIIIIKPPMHVTSYLFMQPSELTKRGLKQISQHLIANKMCRTVIESVMFHRLHHGAPLQEADLYDVITVRPAPQAPDEVCL